MKSLSASSSSGLSDRVKHKRIMAVGLLLAAQPHLSVSNLDYRCTSFAHRKQV